MPPINPDPTANRPLAALPRGDHRRLLAGCEPVELVFAEVPIKVPGWPRERCRGIVDVRKAPGC